jgi:hypothetical protein
MTLNPTGGPPLTAVTANGTGFAGAETVTVTFDSTTVATLTSGSGGTFSASFVVPAGSAPGNHIVVATETPSNDRARAVFVVHTDWPQYGNKVSRGSHDTSETILKASNVASVGMKWQGAVGQGSTAAAVVNNIVYVGAFTDPNQGNLYAFRVGCTTGGAGCTPLWTGTLGDRDVTSAPAVVGGFVYLAAQDGKLYVFNASGCGASVCSPLWVGTIGSSSTGHSAPAVAGGRVYVTFDQGLFVFKATGCGGPVCAPLWKGLTHDTSTGGVAVSSGRVYVTTKDELETFNAAGCGSPTCSPLWRGPAVWLYDSPAVAGGVVYASSPNNGQGGTLYAFNAAGCGSSTCNPLWSGLTAGRLFYTPAIAGQRVYVSSVDDGRVDVFSTTGCGSASCPPLWSGKTGATFLDTGAAVANGVVYQGGDTKMFEFRAGGCGVASCSPVGSQLLPNLVTGDPVIADGFVYTATENVNSLSTGTVWALGL